MIHDYLMEMEKEREQENSIVRQRQTYENMAAFITQRTTSI